MKSAIRALIETELACGPARTFAERLEKALTERIHIYCGTFQEASERLGESWAVRACRSIESGIIGQPKEEKEPA